MFHKGKSNITVCPSSGDNLWHDQEEWVGCRGCCFWDIGQNSVQFPLFHIVFSSVKSFNHNSVTRYPIVMGFASKWSICFEKVVEENRNLNFRQVTNFPWSCHICFEIINFLFTSWIYWLVFKWTFCDGYFDLFSFFSGKKRRRNKTRIRRGKSSDICLLVPQQ